jgi:hypothetical protein
MEKTNPTTTFIHLLRTKKKKYSENKNTKKEENIFFTLM